MIKREDALLMSTACKMALIEDDSKRLYQIRRCRVSYKEVNIGDDKLISSTFEDGSVLSYTRSFLLENCLSKK